MMIGIICLQNDIVFLFYVILAHIATYSKFGLGCKHLVNELLVLLLRDLAFQLERRCELASWDGKVLR